MICPECGKEMIVRNGAKGQFWGCTGYPNCKKTMQLEGAKTVDTPKVESVHIRNETQHSIVTNKNENADSIEWRSGTGKSVKVYGDAGKPEEFKARLQAAIAILMEADSFEGLPEPQ